MSNQMKSTKELAEEWANKRCPEQGPEFIVWCMCRDDFLAGYVAAQSWISVEDGLPTRAGIFLCYDVKSRSQIMCIFNPGLEINKWEFDFSLVDGRDFQVETVEISHWMPLPPPPKEESK